MSTQTDFEQLVYTLNLSSYQARQIYMHRDEYDISRLEMRGPVLYIPQRCSLFTRIFGTRHGDIIGRNRIFLQGAKNVKLRANGFHTGRVGKTVYYGDPDGRAIPRDTFDHACAR